MLLIYIYIVLFGTRYYQQSYSIKKYILENAMKEEIANIELLLCFPAAMIKLFVHMSVVLYQINDSSHMLELLVLSKSLLFCQWN